jgi:transglutaminase-like putative cysteine protease
VKLRTIIGPAIVIGWVGVLGMHVKREYFKSTTTLLTEGARSLAPGRFFYTVRANNVTIGLGSSRLDTIKGEFRFEDDLTLDVPALGKTHRSRAVTGVTLARDLSLRNFDFMITSEIGNFTVQGTAQPDSTITLRMNAGGKEQTTSVKADRGLLLDAAIPLRLAAAKAFAVGKEFTVRVFDPSSMDSRNATMKVTARDTLVVPDSAVLVNGRWVANRHARIPTWKLEQRFGSVVISTWVDDDGQIVRATSPLGYTIERTYAELARQDWREGRAKNGALAEGYGALIQGTAISSNIDVSALPNQDVLRVRLGDVDLTGFDLEGGRQKLYGDTLVITREATLPAPGYALPYRGTDSLITAELEAAPLIQINDPLIQSTAHSIVGSTTDPVEASRKLTTWVYGTLAKEITLSVPSARQVLDAKSGDCNEHTVLYVALARAVGLPARTAAGLVYLRGHFYYHAWPEVWLGQWVAVDPTLGQYPADASHLRFTIGGLARQVELIRLIGRLKLEVI